MAQDKELEGMEQGFNEDELADIMSEIESLEQGLEESEENAAPEIIEEELVEESMDDFVEEEVVEEHCDEKDEKSEYFAKKLAEMDCPEAEEVDPMEEAQQMIEAEEAEDVVEVEEVHYEPEVKKVVSMVHHAEHDSEHEEKRSMDFCVPAHCGLDLTFNMGGKKFCVAISEEHGLEIQLDDGFRFSVPLEKKTSLRSKKVA